MEMSGERISGSPQTPSSSGDGSSQGSTAAWSNAHDDVELEKSNILMLGPTGESCLSFIFIFSPCYIILFLYQ